MKTELTKLTELKTSELNSENSVSKSFGSWLPDMDLNHDKQIQSLLCYRYTIGQKGARRSVNLSITESSC
jgi:hypothetical protein